MKDEKYSRNIYVYQLKYLNKRNLNKENAQVLKSDLPKYKLHKVFEGLVALQKVRQVP